MYSPEATASLAHALNRLLSIEDKQRAEHTKAIMQSNASRL